MLRTRVLVVGGGPAGATAARFLVRKGIETLIIDRDLSCVKPCGGGIPSSGIDEFNIPRSVVAREVHRILVVSPKGERVDVALTGGCLCITHRNYFDTTLRELAVKEGATLKEAAFLGFEEMGAKPIAIVRDKELGNEVRVQSDYVIAADGVASRVASSLGLRKIPAIATVSARLPLDLADQPNRSDTESRACEFWFGSCHAPRFYSWVFPSNHDASVGTGGMDAALLPELFTAFVQRRFPFSQESTNVRMRPFRIPLWNGDRFNVGNVLFVGDAAGTVMPITCEGIYYAMKSGQFAAEALAQGKPFHYRKLWNRRFRAHFLLMNALRDHLFRSDDHIERWIGLHRRVDLQSLALTLWLTKEGGSKNLRSYASMLRGLLGF